MCAVCCVLCVLCCVVCVVCHVLCVCCVCVACCILCGVVCAVCVCFGGALTISLLPRSSAMRSKNCPKCRNDCRSSDALRQHHTQRRQSLV